MTLKFVGNNIIKHQEVIRHIIADMGPFRLSPDSISADFWQNPLLEQYKDMDTAIVKASTTSQGLTRKKVDLSCPSGTKTNSSIYLSTSPHLQGRRLSRKMENSAASPLITWKCR